MMFRSSGAMQVLCGPSNIMKGALIFILVASFVTNGTCTVLAAAGYIASASPMRNILMTTGLSNAIASGAYSFYHASGFRHKNDQGTDIRKAVVKNHNIMEIESPHKLRRRASITEKYSKDGRAYSERLFGVLKRMDKNTCLARLLCEIGSEPSSFGVFGLKINHYVKSVPPVTWNSETFPYIEAFEYGLNEGRGACKQYYSSCTYNLHRVMDFLWYFINPVHF